MILNNRLSTGSGRMLRLEFETNQSERESLDLLLEITKAMTSELDLEKLMLLIMDKTRGCLQAERCSVFLMDDRKEELWTLAAHGLEGHKIRVPLQLGLVGYVARTGETVNVQDAYQDYRFDREIDKTTGYRTASVLAMPMKNKQGAIMGVFQILNKHQGVFTQDDQHLLEGVVAMAAIAVENAQLYEKARNRSFDTFVEALSFVRFETDPVALNHAKRMAANARAIADELGLDETRKQELWYACLLHDVVHMETLRDLLLHEEGLSVQKFSDLTETVQLAKSILSEIIDKKCLQKLLHVDTGNVFPPTRIVHTERIIDAKIVAFCELVDIVLHCEMNAAQNVSAEVRLLLSAELMNHFDQRIVNYFLCNFQRFV